MSFASCIAPGNLPHGSAPQRDLTKSHATTLYPKPESHYKCLALCRVFGRNAKWVVPDEATVSMDPERDVSIRRILSE